MPKAMLEFSLPEEYPQHLIAVKGHDLVCAVKEFKNWLRNQIKHAEIQPSLEDAEAQLYEYLTENHVMDLVDC